MRALADAARHSLALLAEGWDEAVVLARFEWSADLMLTEHEAVQ
jgi:hypothetical protein